MELRFSGTDPLQLLTQQSLSFLWILVESVVIGLYHIHEPQVALYVCYVVSILWMLCSVRIDDINYLTGLDLFCICNRYLVIQSDLCSAYMLYDQYPIQLQTMGSHQVFFEVATSGYLFVGHPKSLFIEKPYPSCSLDANLVLTWAFGKHFRGGLDIIGAIYHIEVFRWDTGPGYQEMLDELTNRDMAREWYRLYFLAQVFDTRWELKDDHLIRIFLVF